jgi:hypothetical protein
LTGWWRKRSDRLRSDDVELAARSLFWAVFVVVGDAFHDIFGTARFAVAGVFILIAALSALGPITSAPPSQASGWGSSLGPRVWTTVWIAGTAVLAGSNLA